jgi:hypothetical protein
MEGSGGGCHWVGGWVGEVQEKASKEGGGGKERGEGMQQGEAMTGDVYGAVCLGQADAKAPHLFPAGPPVLRVAVGGISVGTGGGGGGGGGGVSGDAQRGRWRS